MFFLFDFVVILSCVLLLCIMMKILGSGPAALRTGLLCFGPLFLDRLLFGDPIDPDTLIQLVDQIADLRFQAIRRLL